MKNITFIISLLIIITSCDIENPGPIEQESLNNPNAIPGIVVGMSADFSYAYRHTTRWGSMWADELKHSGTYAAPTAFEGGNLPSDRVSPWWNEAHRARWVAEHGVKRIKKILDEDAFNKSEYAARAYLWAGYSNRSLGENVCKAVIDGDKAQDFTLHFKRAEDNFKNALNIAENIGNDKFRYAALAGRASVKAALGDWKSAVEDAKKVPVDYKFEAIYSLNSDREHNMWFDRTIKTGDFTVYGTKWAGSDDPRVPQKVIYTADGDTATAADGKTFWIAQQKYKNSDSNIPLSKGTEMILIRAENQLRENNINPAMQLINQEREYYDLPELSANTIKEAWQYLERERGKVLWLEGRRFWDLRRWFQETGPSHNDFLKGRDTCVPIGQQELDSNQNL